MEALLTVWAARRVGLRMSPNGVYNCMGSPDFCEQFTYVAGWFDQYGLSCLHLIDGLEFGFHNLGEPMTLADFRNVFHSPLIGNCGYTEAAAEQAVADGHADLLAFGRPFLTNPDRVERLRHNWPLAAPAEMSARYSPTGSKGDTDFPNDSAT